VLVTNAVPVRVCGVGGAGGVREGAIFVRYAIVILAVLACAFYVFVLIQLRRDEKSHSLHSSQSPSSSGGPVKLESSTAVRKPGHSFAEWSRLSRQRNVVEVGAKPASLRKPNKAAGGLSQVSHVELSSPQPSDGARAIEDGDSHHGRSLPKKIA
jgi:hypothetical protein